MATITLRCAHCGSDRFIKPENAKPDDTVRCVGCNRESRYADVQRAGMDAAKKLVNDTLRKAGFKPR